MVRIRDEYCVTSVGQYGFLGSSVVTCQNSLGISDRGERRLTARTISSTVSSTWSSADFYCTYGSYTGISSAFSIVPE